MKKLIPIFLTFIILFNAAGYFLLHTSALLSHKRELKRMAHEKIYTEHKLTTLILSTEEYAALDWKEHNEFYYNDELYDKISSTNDGKTVTIVCINDKLEKQLIAGFAKEKGAKKSAGNYNPVKIYFFQENLLIEHSPLLFLNTISFNYVEARYNATFPKPLPPPKLA